MDVKWKELQLGTALGLIVAWQGIFHTAASRFAATTEGGLLFVQVVCLTNALAIFVGAFGCKLWQRWGHHTFSSKASLVGLLVVIGLVTEAFFGVALIRNAAWFVVVAQCIAVAIATFLLIGSWEQLLEFAGDSLVKAFLVALLTCGVAEFIVAPLGELLWGTVGILCIQGGEFLLYCLVVASLHDLKKTDDDKSVTTVHIDAINDQDKESSGIGSGKLLPGSALPLQFALALFCYFAVMGVVHAAISEIDDVTLAFMPPRLIGLLLAVAGAALLLKRKPSAFVFPWPLLREVVFPITVLTLMSLGLLHQGFGLSSAPLLLGQFSTSFFDLLITLMICYMAREMGTSVRLFTASTYMVQGLASALGIFLGAVVSLRYSFMGTAASTLVAMGSFLLLTMGTFWVGTDKRVQKVWGLRIEKKPRAVLDERRAERIDALASQYGLTPREAEIALLLVGGMRPQAAADHLCVSVNTVRTHSKAVYRKLNVHSQGELVHLVDGEISEERL